METEFKKVAYVEFESFLYPVKHWEVLNRFAEGDELDPKGIFKLADDRWEGWAYAAHGRQTTAGSYRLLFARLGTFLKLYAKWYCYHALLGAAGKLRQGLRILPKVLYRADAFIAGHGFKSIDDIASSVVFDLLWADLLYAPPEGGGPMPYRCVIRQAQTRAFWLRLSEQFGVPLRVPPVAPYVKVAPAEYGASRDKVIPDYVIKQLVNGLGLHRDGKRPLTRHDHLRLCVLLLGICLGRRVGELLSAPRGEGDEGPLARHPSKGGPPEGSLWFEFVPNKNGPNDKVLVSREWEDLTLYCVRELVAYGDEVRHLAAPEERGLLILVSPLNWTWGTYACFWPAGRCDLAVPDTAGPVLRGKHAGAFSLSAGSFTRWMNGNGKKNGIFERLGITADGSAEGPPYRMTTHFTRHTRHSALALDPAVPLRTRQNDLNHRDRNMQFAYQHRLAENNEALLEKIKEGKIVGRGVGWLCEVLGVGGGLANNHRGFSPGAPALLTPEWRALIRNNPAFFRLNRVPEGICIHPEGPAGCTEFMNCTTAAEGGCHCFVADADDESMLLEMDVAAAEDRRLESAASGAGRTVEAGRHGVLARRTEELRDEAMRRASHETLEKLRELKERMEGGSREDEDDEG